MIGGTSLFGGRGKPLDGVLGGIVIAAIYNGIFLAPYWSLMTWVIRRVESAKDSAVARRWLKNML